MCGIINFTALQINFTKQSGGGRRVNDKKKKNSHKYLGHYYATLDRFQVAAVLSGWMGYMYTHQIAK